MHAEGRENRDDYREMLAATPRTERLTKPCLMLHSRAFLNNVMLENSPPIIHQIAHRATIHPSFSS